MRRARKPSNAISYQVSLGGKGISALSKEAMRELIERTLDGTPPPAGISVRIQCWRAGQELDMDASNPRAVVLRDTFRRLLLSGRIKLSLRAGEEDDE